MKEQCKLITSLTSVTWLMVCLDQGRDWSINERNWTEEKSNHTHFNIVQFSFCVLAVQIFSSKCLYMEYVCSRSNLHYWYLISSIFNNFLLCFCAGDPLYEFLAVHISVFKLDPVLLKLCLRAYGLPLAIPSAIGKVANGGVLTDASSRDYTRPSYRAM